MTIKEAYAELDSRFPDHAGITIKANTHRVRPGETPKTNWDVFIFGNGTIIDRCAICVDRLSDAVDQVSSNEPEASIGSVSAQVAELTEAA